MAKKVVKKAVKKPIKKVVKKVVKKVAKKVVKAVKTTKKVPVKVTKPNKAAAKEIKIPYNYTDRMNRIVGQVGGVHRMIEAEKKRVDILMQLKAVRAAIKSLETQILEDYLQIAAMEIVNEGDAKRVEKVEDFKKIFLRSE